MLSQTPLQPAGHGHQTENSTPGSGTENLDAAGHDPAVGSGGAGVGAKPINNIPPPTNSIQEVPQILDKISRLRSEALTAGLRPIEVWIGPSEVKVLTPFLLDATRRQAVKTPWLTPFTIEGAKIFDMTIGFSPTDGIWVGAISSIPEPTVKPITVKSGQVIQNADANQTNNQSLNECHQLVLRWNQRAAKERATAERYQGSDTGKKAIAKAQALESAAVELEEYLEGLPASAGSPSRMCVHGISELRHCPTCPIWGRLWDSPAESWPGCPPPSSEGA